LELYLIRHGQAGSRQHYDQLSPLGHQQAAALASWFREQDIVFDQVLSGALHRQQSTALHLHPSPTPLAAWNEFDLDAVYNEVAPLLAAHDPAFALHYAEALTHQQDPAHAIHRQWTPADIAVVRAWVSGRFPTQTESWQQFTTRIQQALKDTPSNFQRLAIVTSATPIGISTGTIFDTPSPRYLQLAAALHNSSFTRFRLTPHGWSLEAFNHTPHLPNPAERTLR
jgi:broad specificity phosphatase PhoE